MSGNNLSFSITAINNASPALNSLKKQISSLKSGINSLGKGSTATSNFLNSISGGSKSVSSLGRGFSNLASKITSTIGAFGGFKLANAAVNSLTGSFDRAIARADTMDLFQQKMTLITNSSETATKALDHLKTSTKGTPYALDIAAKSVQNFVTRGMEAEKATESVDIWMDAVSTYGKGTNDQFESVMDALAKMRTKGTVEMRYLNRLFAAGINPVQMYAQATGQAAEDVQTALSNKELKTEEFLDVVEKAMREGTNGVVKIQGKAREMATTWAATIANMNIAIARGELELLTGIESVALLFNSDGLKGILKDYGNWVENNLTNIGKYITQTVAKGQALFMTLSNRNKTDFQSTNQQISTNNRVKRGNKDQAKQDFTTSIKDTIGPYLDEIFVKFDKLRLTWSNVSTAFSKGIAQIAKPLGQVFGVYLGEAVTNVEDLGIKFGEWLNLKLPVFFDKLEKILNWLIKNKEIVVSSIQKMLKAFLGFKLLEGLRGTVINFNNKMKELNETLAFFTGGRIQLPTIESFVEKNEAKKNQIILDQLEQENKLKKERNLLETTYARERDKLKVAGTKELTGLNKNQIKDEINISKSHKKNLASINTGKDRSLSKLDASYLKDNTSIDLEYQKGLDRINKQRQKASERIAKQQLQMKMPYGSQSALQSELSKIGVDNKELFDFKTAKTVDPKALEKQVQLQEQLYSKMKTAGSTGGDSTYLSEIYNAQAAYEQAKAQLDKSINQKRVNLSDSYKTKKTKIVDDASSRIDLLNEDTRQKMDYTRTKYKSKKKSSGLNTYKQLESLKKQYGVGVAPEEPAQTGFNILDWMKTGTKNLWGKTKEVSSKATKKVGSGSKDFLDTLLSGFKGLKSKDESFNQPLASSPKAGLGKGVMDYFKTMFGGMKGLGAQDKLSMPAIDTKGLDTFAAKSGVISKAIDGIKGAFKGIGETISPGIKAVTTFFTTIGGGVTAVLLAVAAIGGLTAAIGALNPGNALSKSLDTFFNSFGDMVLKFGDYAAQMITNFVTNFKNNLPQLVSQGASLLVSIVTGILTSIPQLLATGAKIIFALVGGLLDCFPDLVRSGFQAIGEFIGGIIRNLPQILSAAWELIKTLILGIVQNLPKILACGVRLIVELIKGIASMMMTIGQAIVDTVWGGIQWLFQNGDKVWAAMQDFGNQILDALKQGLFDVADSMGLGWALEKIITRPTAETAAEAPEEAQKAFDNAAQQATFDWGQVTQTADLLNLPEEAHAKAADTMNAYANGFAEAEVQPDMTGAVDMQMAETAANAGQVGIDTSTNYATGLNSIDTSNLGITSGVANQLNQNAIDATTAGQNTMNNYASGITANGGTVDSALSNVGSAGIGTLTVTFSDPRVVLSVTQFIIAIQTAIIEHIAMVQEAMRLLAMNSVSAFNEEFNSADQASSIVAQAVATITAKFQEAQINASASIETMRADLVGKFNEIALTVDTSMTTCSERINTFANVDLLNFRTSAQSNLQDVQKFYEVFNVVIKALLDDLATYHETAGENMMLGLERGIASRSRDVISTESDIVEQLKDTFETGLGIHSPSKYMTWVGQMMLMGLLNGMPQSQVKKFAESRIESMKNSFKKGKFDPDQLVNYLGEDTMKVVKYLEFIGDETVPEDENGKAYGKPAIIQEAEKYLGYVSPGGNGGSMFGARYGNGGAWCGSFVKYCADNVGVPIGASNPHYVPDMLAWAQASGRSTPIPAPGYAAIFRGAGHIELVADVLPDGNVVCIGGNTGSPPGVYERVRNGATSYIALDGGHSILTLKDAIQQAYFKKMGLGAFGSGSFGSIALTPDMYASAMNIDGSGLINPGWFQAWQPDANVSRWAGTVLQVLAMLGEPASLLKGVLWAIDGESGGDPNSVYTGDVNIKFGGSKGLLQTITPNFEQWKNPNLPNDIFDPTQNIWTCLREMQDTYGSIQNVINKRLANGDWFGYAVGTRNVPRDMLAMIHEGEAIIPKSQNPYRDSGGDYLADMMTAVFGNGLEALTMNPQAVTNNNQTQSTSSQSMGNVNIVFNNNISKDADGDRFIGNLESELHRIFQNGIRTSTPR